jgi:hypothetical protein
VVGAGPSAHVEDRALLVGVEGEGLGGGAQRDDAGRALGEDVVGQRGERVRGDPAVGGERRDQGDEDACEAVFHWPSLRAAIMQVQFAFVWLYVSCADA